MLKCIGGMEFCIRVVEEKYLEVVWTCGEDT